MAASGDRALLKQKWSTLFKKALEADTWGQAIEASDFYAELATTMERQQKDIGLSVDDESAVSKIKLCLRLRVAALTDVVLRKDSLSLEHIKTLGDVFDGMFVRNVAGRFPIDLTKFHAEIARLNGGASGGGGVAGTHGDHDADDESSTFSGSAAARGVAASSDAGAVSAELASGTLLPPPTVLASNFKCLVFEIDAVGLKDAETYLDARITVSVCDSVGNLLEASQDTPITNRKRPQHVVFGNTVYIQTPFEKLPDDFAIFFEFKHYKPDKKKVSTRCFAFMEKDECIASPNIQLELYTKPTDLTRKNIRLHSIKPLYLNLKLSYRKT